MNKNKFRIWDGIKLIYQDDINWIDFRSGFASVFDMYSYANNCEKEIKIDHIMQCTGLKDSYDSEIYEGDIIRIEDYFGKDIIGRVVYDETSACFWIKEGNERNYFMMTFDLESYVHEVIGNIYENKDMLENNYE